MGIKRKGPALPNIVRTVPDAFKAGIPGTLSAIGALLEAEIKRLLLTPGRGRIYKRGKKGTHQASAPGEPPAPDIGNLQRSIAHEVDGNTVRVGTNVEYAEALEWGSIKAGRGRRTVILPRPFMRPAIAATRVQVEEEVVRLMKRGSRRGT